MLWLKRWQQRWQVRRIVRRMASARRAGSGLYLFEWRASHEPGAELHALSEELLAWVRQTVGQCRRPWGIDHFDLTLAWCNAGSNVRSASFSHLKPIDLYGEGGLTARLGDFLSGEPAMPGVTRVAAAIFSWGDAAHAALPNTV